MLGKYFAARFWRSTLCICGSIIFVSGLILGTQYKITNKQALNPTTLSLVEYPNEMCSTGPIVMAENSTIINSMIRVVGDTAISIQPGVKHAKIIGVRIE